MAASREDIFRNALALGDSDRAELIAELILSLEPDPQPGIQDAWRDEINDRVKELESGRVRTVAWDVVRERHARAPRG